MDAPLVTIVIATYNASKLVEMALESVINQRFSDWECIVVDGASSDDTVAIVNKYVSKDSRIRLISEPDRGIYDAFNKGWRNAKGEWIYYLGSDDALLPDGLYDLTHSCKLSDYDVVYGHVKDKLANSDTMSSKTVGHKGLPYRMIANHQAVITRKSILEEMSGFDENLKIIADHEFFVRLYLRGGIKFFYAPNVFVATFSLGGASSSLNAMLRENFYICKKNELGAEYVLFQYIRHLWLKAKRILHIRKGIKL